MKTFKHKTSVKILIQVKTTLYDNKKLSFTMNEKQKIKVNIFYPECYEKEFEIMKHKKCWKASKSP